MQNRTSRMLCGVSVAAAMAFSPVTQANHSWGSYHWSRTSNPFTLTVADNVSSGWDASFGLMISDWSKSSVVRLARADGTVANLRKCNPTRGRVEVCNYSYGRNGWLGIAQIWASGNHITQGTVKLNDTYFAMSAYNKPEWRNMVMCQEVGHTLGLDHQDEDFYNANLGTCMDYTSNPAASPNNEHPNLHDYDQLAAIYSHLDAPGTFLSSPTNEAAGNVPEDWGRLMRTSNGGRTEVFEHELGGGHRVITFVIWAEPRGKGH
ncbi:MAG TPA: hypothetical protein VGD52_26360 [Pseudoduganella sp.]